MSFGRGSTVRVEPTKDPNAPGGVKWTVRVNGSPSSSHNYKDTAVKKARQKGRANNAKLTIKNKDGSVSERVNYGN